jgi:hypothetical protein
VTSIWQNARFPLLLRPDRAVVDVTRSFGDAYPHFRGMIAEIGLAYYTLTFNQPRRIRGITKDNFYTLYDIAMLGITNLSNVPLRFVTFFGFASGVVSMIAALAYLLYELIFWSNFSLGIAPLVIGLFFLGLFSSFRWAFWASMWARSYPDFEATACDRERTHQR